MVTLEFLPPLFAAANRILDAKTIERLAMPWDCGTALIVGLLITVVAVTVVSIWKNFHLEGWTLAGIIIGGTALASIGVFYGLKFTGYGETLKATSINGVTYIPLALILAAFGVGTWLANSLRLKDTGWKFGLILSAWLASTAVILLGEFKLGVDLQGGAILVYEVDEKATAALDPEGRSDNWQMSGVIEIMKRRLNPDGLKELVIRPFGPKQIEVVVPEVDKAEIERLKSLITTGGALRFLIVANSQSKDRDIIDAAKVQAGKKGNEAEYVVKDGEGNVIGYWFKAARENEADSLSPFRDESVYNDIIRDHRTGTIIELTADERANCARDGIGLATVLARRGIQQIDVLLRYDSEYDVRGEDLASASEGRDENLSPAIFFKMKGQGVAKMGALTGNNTPNPERKLAIVFDNELISAPVIRSQISESGQITGRFSVEEVRFMVEILKSGSMPVVLHKNPISENTIGSILGFDTIRKGSMAIVVSLLVVLTFTFVYYRFAGFVACMALVLNILLTVSLMVMLAAPFTLPGLAGIVLTVGMSVDSNVLIFERIREELARGAALRMALRNGFERAMVTIIDSNLTTLLTAVVLYAIGTDQVRGFGVTLILGILTSMFTAIFCARTIFDAGEKLRWLKTLNMMQLLTKTKIDWVKLFRPACVASVVLIVVGLVATVMRGRGIFDIDLAGGTSVTMILKDKVDDGSLRKILDEKFAGMKHSKTGGRVDYSLYEVSVQGQQPQTVYKVDSNLVSDKELQEVLQTALRKPDGSEGLVTYQIDVSEVKTAAATTSPVDDPAPEIGTPTPTENVVPAETTKPGEEKPAETTTPETKPAETKPAEEKPAETKPDEGTPTETTPEETKPAEPESPKPAEEKPAEPTVASACQGEEEKKPASETPEAPAKEADETKKSETKEAPAKPAEPPVTKETEPGVETAPAPSTTAPGVDTPLPSTKPPTAVVMETSAKIKLKDNRITGVALKDRILDAAEVAIKQRPGVRVSHPKWDGRDNSSFDEWTVTLSLEKEPAQAVLDQLKASIEKDPVWQNSSKIEGQVTVDTQLKALTAILVSLVGIAAYIWFRFLKFSWAIAAIVSLVHDTLVMLGFIAMSYWLAPALGFMQVEEFKISLTIIAAFLTLIGYSINDTIVIFDRIREIRGKSPDMTPTMINDAVNQTLSRSILTTGTVLMVVVVLYFFGGSGIHAFAFSMIVGALAGTYSTVFIAAPLLLWLMSRKDAKAGVTSKPAIAERVTSAR